MQCPYLNKCELCKINSSITLTFGIRSTGTLDLFRQEEALEAVHKLAAENTPFSRLFSSWAKSIIRLENVRYTDAINKHSKDRIIYRHIRISSSMCVTTNNKRRIYRMHGYLCKQHGVEMKFQLMVRFL